MSKFVLPVIKESTSCTIKDIPKLLADVWQLSTFELLSDSVSFDTAVLVGDCPTHIPVFLRQSNGEYCTVVGDLELKEVHLKLKGIYYASINNSIVLGSASDSVESFLSLPKSNNRVVLHTKIENPISVKKPESTAIHIKKTTEPSTLVDPVTNKVDPVKTKPTNNVKTTPTKKEIKETIVKRESKRKPKVNKVLGFNFKDLKATKK